MLFRSAPSAADLNSAAGFTNPTADDIAGKKAMFATAEKLSKSITNSSASFDGLFWNYGYDLRALVGPTFSEQVTRFTLDLPHGDGLGDLSGFVEPNGWSHEFFDGTFDRSPKLVDDEASSPSLISFFATASSFGVFPGQEAHFGFSSLFGPAASRSFTNSPSFDSDESQVLAPAQIPEPSSALLLVLGLGVVGIASRGTRGASRRG